MTKINLREHYPDYYPQDTFIEVSDEVAATMLAFKRQEVAYQRRIRYNHAYYSLDQDGGMGCAAVFVSMTPWEVYERKLTLEQLHAAIATLPDRQAKRIYAYFILGLTMQEIAKSENVTPMAVSLSIQRGLRRLEKILKNSL